MGQPVRHRTRSRADVIAKYRAWIVTQPERMKALDELRGRDLVSSAHRRRSTVICC